MTRLAASLLVSTGHLLGILRPHPRQLIELGQSSLPLRSQKIPSTFRHRAEWKMTD